MNIQKATRQYETWLGAYTNLIAADIDYKHEQMAVAAFPFLRATFYRWAQVWPQVCSDLAACPTVLAVADLHVENFGTWRDAEGRLIWGVNDFDEACHLPYTNDIVRLAASALLAFQESHVKLNPQRACAAVLAGYTRHMRFGGKPFVLAEENTGLRDMAQEALKEPVAFWAKIEELPGPHEPVSESAVVAIEHLLPAPDLRCELKSRRAGIGSLGHPRIIGLTEWKGGRIAREAKALVPSACVWAPGPVGAVEIFYQAVMDRAVRCRDPFVQLQGQWIVRRLAPDCSRIELKPALPEQVLLDLLDAMGAETANIHLGSANSVSAVTGDLMKRDERWLHDAAVKMRDATIADWEEWKKG